jgi:arsenate reductase (thioredoxin)
MKKQRVLILCTGNSARSQIAEGLFRQKAGERFEVFSAGTRPKGLNPFAVEVMREVGLDISSQTSKDVRIFEGQPFDFVITVCDNAKESCPVFPGANKLHWSTHDPTTLSQFRSVRDELSKRIDTFLQG